MNNKTKKEIWLFISGFGIMFAVLSWLQESSILSKISDGQKDFYAVVSGFFLYRYFRGGL